VKKIFACILSVFICLSCLISCECLFNNDQIAEILIDYENELLEKEKQLEQNNPEYEYLYQPVAEVYCYFYIKDGGSAEAIAEKYDLYNAFAGADVFVYEAYEAILFYFYRDDFTELAYQKLNFIAKIEKDIEEFYVGMYREWTESYVPKIESFVDNTTELSYVLADKKVTNLHTDVSFIIKSKAEYEAYMDSLVEMAKYSYEKNNINCLRDLYDEVFFENNSLIITKVIVRGSGSIRLTVDNVYISDSKIYVVVRTDKPDAGTCDMQYKIFGLVVDKESVKDIDEVITLD